MPTWAEVVLLLALLPALCESGFEKVYEELAPRRSKLEIVVGITTTPRRVFGSLQSALEGIFSQRLAPDKVILALPRGPLRRLPQERYPEDSELPAYLAQPRAGLVIDRDCPDDGPGTCLFCALNYARSPDALVVTWPDDIVYSGDHLAVLVHAAIQDGARGAAVSVVGTHSMRGFKPCFDEASWSEGCIGRRDYGHPFGPVTIGWMGTLVRPWFFGPEGLKPARQPEWPNECQKHDDLWLGAMLARRGIRRASFNGGLLGVTRALDGSRTGTALLSGNRWNLFRCNEALLERWPSLWEPRPRLVAFADSASWPRQLASDIGRCLGHVDHWYDERGSDEHFSPAIPAAASHESGEAVAVVFRDADDLYGRENLSREACAALSAAVQCAMARPEARCPASTGIQAFAWVASFRAWRQDSAPSAALEERGCWARANASWGLCCGDRPGVKDRHLAALARRVCPSSSRLADRGCCAVHPKLSRHWAHLAGVWEVSWDDGSQGQWAVSDQGLVEITVTKDTQSTLAGPWGERTVSAWQLEETDRPGLARLVPAGSTDARPADRHAVEVWRLVESRIESVAVWPGGEMMTAEGKRPEAVGVV